MWNSRNKVDLIIEVWEKLDCESIGRVEIEAIEVAVAAAFGDQAVESPMNIARLLADEGAALRHSEIMSLWVERYTDRPYEAEFRNLIRIDTLAQTLRSIRHAENLRSKYVSANDKEGIRLLRQDVIDAKERARKRSQDKTSEPQAMINAEIAEWLTIWLQSPDIFDNWVTLRRRSTDFKTRFGRD
jgi:hypothetical protein